MRKKIQMIDREEKLMFIAGHLRKYHVGWRNAISMKTLAKAADLSPSLLKADHTNPNAGYIPELRKRGFHILSCNRGYYWPRSESDPEGRDEDFKKCESRLRGQGLGNLFAAAESKRSVKYAGEMRFEW